eukprot:gb/GEZN01003221.1/.p1 GENE.gb/GEZN01003221.1/~~gb/GEZN01003221.1/.p1  ORF type:complete len:655 (+),score=51.01 gb/GEZN01003221.1/:102-2066(+)
MSDSAPVLMQACTKASEATVKVFVSHPNIDLQQSDTQGNVALMVTKVPTVMQLLLDSKAKVDQQNHKGETSLSLNVMSQDQALCQILLTHKAGLHVADRTGKTPLMHASRLGSLPIVQLLLENQADPNCRDARGNTALLQTCTNCLESSTMVKNISDISKALLDAKADASILNDDGVGVLSVLPRVNIPTLNDTSDWFKILDLLLEHKADINQLVEPSTAGKSGFTLSYRCCQDRAEIALLERLIRCGADLRMQGEDKSAVWAVCSMADQSRGSQCFPRQGGNQPEQLIRFLVTQGAVITLEERLCCPQSFAALLAELAAGLLEGALADLFSKQLASGVALPSVLSIQNAGLSHPERTSRNQRGLSPLAVICNQENIHGYIPLLLPSVFGSEEYHAAGVLLHHTASRIPPMYWSSYRHFYSGQLTGDPYAVTTCMDIVNKCAALPGFVDHEASKDAAGNSPLVALGASIARSSCKPVEAFSALNTLLQQSKGPALWEPNHQGNWAAFEIMASVPAECKEHFNSFELYNPAAYTGGSPYLKQPPLTGWNRKDYSTLINSKIMCPHHEGPPGCWAMWALILLTGYGAPLFSSSAEAPRSTFHAVSVWWQRAFLEQYNSSGRAHAEMLCKEWDTVLGARFGPDIAKLIFRYIFLPVF